MQRTDHAAPESVADHTAYIPAESVTGPAGEVYQKQIAFWQAEREWSYMRERLQDDWDHLARAGRQPVGHVDESPILTTLHREMGQARSIMEQAQQEIGGIVYCVATDNLSKLHKKLISLSARAAKLGLDPIELKVTDEKVLLHYTYAEDEGRGYGADFEHVYCILSGGTPKVEGFHFLASIEHTDAGNLIKKIPPIRAQTAGLFQGSDERVQQALESIDVERYRTTPPLCDHCHKIRSRKDTYLVYNNETGEIKQVGRSCLRDYTGADNPEQIVKFLEMYWEQMGRMRGSRGETPRIPTVTFLSHVAVVIGSEGYQKDGITRDAALDNYYNMLKDKQYKGAAQYKVPTEAQVHAAEVIRDWALNEWSDDNDYSRNVKVAIANEVVPEKGYGIVASVFAAKPRWEANQERRQQREDEQAQQAERGFVGTEGERFTGLKVKVLSVNIREGYFDQDAYTIRMEDEDGNRIVWFASNLPRVQDQSESYYLVEGGVYEIRGSVKKHQDHDRFGKSTIITRGRFDKTISEPEGER